MTLTTSIFLRRALVIDAVVTGTTAALLVLAAPVLGQWLAIPVPLRYEASP
jgi:hypothetical protein